MQSNWWRVNNIIFFDRWYKNINFFYRKLPSFPDHTVSVKYAIEHRCGVRVRGPGLTDTITGTDPLKDK